MKQKTFTKAQYDQLIKNGQATQDAIEDDGNTPDHKPVVKFFCPWGAATWLISELDPSAPDMAFGLCDMGSGDPELGYVNIKELEAIKGPFGLTIERDIHFKADKTLVEYAEDAREKGRIDA